MREGSLPPFGLGFSPWERARRLLGRFASRLRPGPRRKPSEVHPALDEKAATAIQEHERSHASLFDRAARLTEKAERLEHAGTPSESASNRAGRARDEAAAELAVLRASFAADAGKWGLIALDRQLRRRYPGLELTEHGA
ncbi:MAG: hypothetical protein H0V83_12895 [Rubrobacter sp.]|nr:hypothetical protein [Rubrobacter sp.]